MHDVWLEAVLSSLRPSSSPLFVPFYIPTRSKAPRVPSRWGDFISPSPACDLPGSLRSLRFRQFAVRVPRAFFISLFLTSAEFISVPVLLLYPPVGGFEVVDYCSVYLFPSFMNVLYMTIFTGNVFGTFSLSFTSYSALVCASTGRVLCFTP